MTKKRMTKKRMINTRQDKFEVGDTVTFIDLDDYTNDAVLQRHWRKFGRGPYVVEDVEDIPEDYLKMPTLPSMGHTQIVCINGERYSGYWLKPVRPVEDRNEDWNEWDCVLGLEFCLNKYGDTPKVREWFAKWNRTP